MRREGAGRRVPGGLLGARPPPSLFAGSRGARGAVKVGSERDGRRRAFVVWRPPLSEAVRGSLSRSGGLTSKDRVNSVHFLLTF